MSDLMMDQIAKIKVVGVGGGGCNAVNRMIEEGVQSVDFYVVNTDLHVLNASLATNKIQIGKSITGAGMDQECPVPGGPQFARYTGKAQLCKSASGFISH